MMMSTEHSGIHRGGRGVPLSYVMLPGESGILAYILTRLFLMNGGLYVVLCRWRWGCRLLKWDIVRAIDSLQLQYTLPTQDVFGNYRKELFRKLSITFSLIESMNQHKDICNDIEVNQ